MSEPYYLKHAATSFSGLIISCPHAGRDFPKESQHYYQAEQVACPVDTDWFIESLYDFAPQLGIPLLWGRYSRYVIDLNRSLDAEPLYKDNRLQTGLIPKTTFLGEKLYPNQEPDQAEIDRRIQTIYKPYHQQLKNLAEQVHAELGYVLILEGHSIRRLVPTISQEPFPDMILGNNDHQTLAPEILDLAQQTLQNHGGYQVSVNHPFKGGYITRAFANPKEQRFTLQLEMSQNLYMDEESFQLLPAKAALVKNTLQAMIQTLSKAMKAQYGQ